MTYEEAKKILDAYLKATDGDSKDKTVIDISAGRVAALYVPLAMMLSGQESKAIKIIKDTIE